MDTLSNIWSEQTTKHEQLKKELDPKIQELSKKIEGLKNEIDSLDKTIHNYKTEIYFLEQSISGEKNRYEDDFFNLINTKLQCERLGEKPITALEDDESIVQLEKKKNSAIRDIEKKIKELENEQKPYLSKLNTCNNELKQFEKEKDSLSQKIKESKDLCDSYFEQMVYADIPTTSQSSSPYDSDIDECDYSCSSTSYSSHSSYSPSSYDSDRYAREQAEEAKTLAREAQKQTDLIKRQMEESKRQMQKMEHEAKERRLEEERRRRQQEEAERREKQRQKEKEAQREQLKRYQGVVYFKSGRSETTGTSNSRRLAEQMAQQKFDHAMKIAVNDSFKPTRFEVIEVYPW